MRRRRLQAPKLCGSKICGRPVEPWQSLCNSCFRRLPFTRRRAIAEARQARAPHIVARLAIEAADWLDRNSPAAEAARRMGEREAAE